MRNLKKLIAVIMTVALLASMMVPALAAVTYQSEAETLQTLDLMKGDATGDLMLDKKLSRLEALILTVRAMGAETAAMALTDAEVAAEMAKIEDAAAIPSWAGAANYAAYAVKMGITNGVGGAAAGMIKFAPGADVSAKQFVTMMLRALGYTGDDLYASAFTKAAELGVITVAEAVGFGTATTFNRDGAAGVIYGALTAKVAIGTDTLIQTLVAAGAVDSAKAVAAGLMTTPTVKPATPLAFTATSVNAKQFLLTFNQAVNADDGKDEAFFAVDTKTVGDVTVQADGMSVLLTLANDEAMGNNSTAKITVKKDFRSAAGVKAAADVVVKDIPVFDTTFPTFDSVTAVGLKTLRLSFSEPVWDTLSSAAITLSSFSVKNATYTWSVTAAKANTLEKYVELTLGTNLIEGAIDVKVVASKLKDYAGNVVAEKTIAYTFAKDASAPVASIDSAKQTEVKIKFNKPVYGDVKVTHSVKGVYTATGGVQVVAEADAKDTYTFSFSTNKLPAGTVTVFVEPDTDKTIKDLYGNKFVATNLTATITIDTTAPVLSSAEVVGDNVSYNLTFDEALKTSEAIKSANYTLKKADGTAVLFNATIKPSSDDKVVVITPTVKFADNTTYELVVKKAVDVYDNATTADITKSFTVGDNTQPSISADTFVVNADGKIYLYFSEAMNATEMVKKANYLVDKDGGTNAFASLGDNDTVTAVSDKIALIDIDGVVTNPSVQVSTAVVDLAGKKLSTTALSVNKEDIGVETFKIDKAEATAKNKIKITFTKEVSAFNSSDIVVSAGAAVIGIAAVESVSGKEVVIQTTIDMATNATSTAAVSVAAIASPVTTKSIYGTMVGVGAATVADKITPEVTKTGDDYNVTMSVVSVAGVVTKGAAGLVVVNFSEAMAASTFSQLTYTVAGYTVGVVTASGTTFTMAVTCDDVNTTAQPTVTQVYNVKDANGNVLASGTAYATKYVEP